MTPTSPSSTRRRLRSRCRGIASRASRAQLLEDVLKKDPKNQRALWLLGISDYQSENYVAAIATWKTLLPMLSPDSDVARSVRNEIADAEARRDGREPPEPEEAPAQSVATAEFAPETPSGAERG